MTAPLSFSGHPLEGDRIVRLVYMDEAGISVNEPWTVVSGIIVDADRQLVAIERRLNALVEKWISDEHRENFVFHAADLFNGGGPVFDRRSVELSKRLQIADDLARIPLQFDLPLAFGMRRRANPPEPPEFFAAMSEEERRAFPHVMAFVTCSMHIDHWMRQQASNEICLLIVEDNQEVRSVLRQTQKNLQSGAWVGNLDLRHSAHFPFRKIKEDPLFQPKRSSSVLQIADFCAYVYKRILTSDARYERFFDPMRHQIAFVDKAKFA
jgi:hypothetical protein